MSIDIRPYIMHMRPKEWPIVGLHLIAGMLCSKNFDFHDAARSTFIFILLLNGGTLALNSSFDNDEGDIAFLNNPPKPPKYLKHFGLLLLSLSLFASMLEANKTIGDKYFFEIIMTCVLMSIAYSTPPIRLKSRPGYDLVINSIGFGFFTFLAGFVSTGNAFTPEILKLSVGFGFLFGALYPLTQIYQNDEDSRRGDQTLTLWLGTNKALNLSMGFSLVAFLWIIWGTLHSGIYTIMLLFNLMLWLYLLYYWKRRLKSMSAMNHKRFMYFFLLLWPLTDFIVLGAHFARY